MIKALIFDLDGTLINSLDDLANSSNYALSQLGYATHLIDDYKYFIGDGVLKLMERILPKEKVTADEIKKIHKIQIEHYTNHLFDMTKPYKGIIELLEKLKKKKYKLAVVSNKSDLQVKKIVSYFFRDGLFDVVSGHRDGYLPKPDPALTDYTIDQLGVEAFECCFVGDSAMDMLTSVNVGSLPIGVSWGFRTVDELIKNGAKYIVNNPFEILELLTKLKTENIEDYNLPVFLMSVRDDREADIIESLLGSYSIPIIREYQGVGSYMKIYMGNSNLGVDIYVLAEFLGVANDILNS